MLRRLPPSFSTAAGFLIGLLLASLDKLLSPVQVQDPVLHVLIETVDWIAPPLCGALVAVSVRYAMRHRQLLETERAASAVLAERLAGTERRQALWVVAAAVAHDLKNPLHNLQLLVEELSDETRPDERADLLRRVRDNLTRANVRIQELARAGHAPMDVEEGSVDVGTVLTEIRQRLQPNADAARTAISVDCPKSLQARSAPLVLRSAVENVAANALEALRTNGRGGALTLSARRGDEDGSIDIFVEDDGPGIPEAIRSRLFVPFAASHSGSTGLGLAIARALARSSGGELTCTSFGPDRTRFRFTFRAR